MRPHLPSKFRAWLMTLVWLLPAVGCSPPDRWSVLQVDFQRRLAEDAFQPADILDEYQPRLTRPPAFEPEICQGTIDLSVEQVAMLALQSNQELRVRRLNPLITGTFEQIERGVFDPELFGEFEYFREKANEVSRSTREQFRVKGDETTAVAGVRQQLPTGTEVEAQVSQERTISNRAPEQQTARVGLTVTQSLLRGLGPAVNLASVRQAELDTVAGVYELRGFVEALLADAEIAYWNYILAKEEIAIFERSLAVAKQQRDEVELRIEVGVLPEIEAAAARAEYALREQALIDARSVLEERRLRLLRLVSPDAEGRLDLRINARSEPRIEPEPITDLADRLRLSEQSRPDLNEARVRLRQNRLETVVTRNGLLPRLELFIDLGRTGYADTFSDSFRRLDEGTYDFTAGIRLSHYLGNRAAKARELAARVSRRQAALAVENLRQIVRLDVRLAVNEVERARQQIPAARITRTLQEETLNAEKERFDVGASTALLVAQAQRDLLAARITEIEAVVHYRIALVGLYLAEGSLLDRRGVRLEAEAIPVAGR